MLGTGGKEALGESAWLRSRPKGATLHCTRLESHSERKGDRKGVICCLFRIKASRSTPHIHGASWLDSGAFRSGKEKGHLSVQARRLDGGAAETPEHPAVPRLWRHCPHGRGVAEQLQALLSSTFTARGLIAPVRFIWEAAEGASCSFMAPRLGFSSTRGFAW